jgi:hypothetical protein
MKNKFFISLLAVFLIAGVTSCSNDDDDDTVEQEPFTATQSDLNAATTEIDIGVTGTPYGEDVTVAHNGQPISPDSTIRDIYATLGSISDDIDVGTVFSKHTYIKNEDGSKGPLAVTFAMIKHEAGDNPDGGDWEYVVMPNDGSNDYDENPNGKLPPESAEDMRGALANCMSCHSAGGDDYLFVK